jgi:hypothetical protein
MRVNAEGPAGTYKAVVRWGEYLESSSTLTFEKSASAALRTGPTAGSDRPTLGQNSPNPFNPATTIEYVLPQQTQVSLEVYNVVGQRVAQLVDGVQSAGSHRVVFDARDLASGVYLYRLQTPASVLTKKLVVVK